MTAVSAVRPEARPARVTAALALGRAATLALYDELALSPKPGLVTLTDRGSHDDMDARTFVRSLLALRRYFPRIASLGAAGASFEELERCGIDAEARMLAATGGINTHRGAIFTLGLLCAAAGALAAAGRTITPEGLRAELCERWGDALTLRAKRPPTLPGARAAQRYGLRSASVEAALGFPVLFGTAVPMLRNAMRLGRAAQPARIDTLFGLIAALDDANLAHRGGLDGLAFARRAACEYLAQGGASSDRDFARARSVGRAFVARRLSPGGAADMLAATCWMQRIGAIGLAP